jgi:hypothetical protein
LDIVGAEGYGWDLILNGKSYPLSGIRLAPGTYKAKLENFDYEGIDFSVDIKKGERKEVDVSSKLVHKFGFLNVKQAYVNGMGESADWKLQIDSAAAPSLYKSKLLPGKHDLKLSHNCYDDFAGSVEIEKGQTETFDMAGGVKPKEGNLSLALKRNWKSASEPVFVNGAEAGKTPFKGTVPVCSEIKIGKDKVDVGIKHNGDVEYLHSKKTASFYTAVALEVVGAGLLAYGLVSNFQAAAKYDDYKGVKAVGRAQYDAAWKEVEDAQSRRNLLYILGGATLGLGVGLHIAF